MQKSYNYFLSYAKAIAIIFVIVIHLLTLKYQYDLFFDAIIVSAVPIFLIIACYNWGNSYERNGLTSFAQMYNWKLLCKRFLRILIPFSIIFIAEEHFLFSEPQTINQIFTDFLYGGIGAGRNMLPMIMEILLVYPLLYKFIKKFRFGGVIWVIVANFLFELFCAEFSLERKIYMINVLRYGTSCALGTYLCFVKNKMNKVYLSCLFSIGIAYLLVLCLIKKPIYPFVIHPAQAFPLQMLHFSIFYLFYVLFSNKKIDNYFGKVVDIIGKSSWHIFLVQMFYFADMNKYVLNCFANNRIGYNVCTVSICVLAGVIFWFVENKLQILINKYFYKNTAY